MNLGLIVGERMRSQLLNTRPLEKLTITIRGVCNVEDDTN